MQSSNSFRRFLATACFTILTSTAIASATDSPRERLLLDFGWRFHLGNEWGTAINWAKAGTGSGLAGLESPAA